MNNNGIKTKKVRQAKILEIIGKYRISTQDELAEHLRREGFESTQATVSRDIRELQLLKSADGNGEYVYTAPDVGSSAAGSKSARVLADAVTGTAIASNLLVIRTYAGMANAACAAIDTMGWPQVVGSIAGDDTIFIACPTQGDAVELSGILKEIITQ
ncbi:MAG: arginine repressor [Clostridia bacterium]|nr:arginine repressor [Clostridia bacterium]